MRWDLVLKLDLHFPVLAGPVNNAQTHQKKNADALEMRKRTIQTHTNSAQ